MESRCSSSEDFDTPNYRYVAATSMGNHGAAVIARRVRGRFSVTRLLSRLVRFYFALSREFSPSCPSLCDPASPSPAHLTLLFPLDPSFPVAFPTSVARTLVPRGAPSLSFSSLSSFVFLPSCSRSRLPLRLFPFSRYRSSTLPFRPHALPSVSSSRPLAPTLSQPRPIHLTLFYPPTCPLLLLLLLLFLLLLLLLLLVHPLARLFRSSYVFSLLTRSLLSLSLAVRSLASCGFPDLFSLLPVPFSRAIGDKASGSCPSI